MSRYNKNDRKVNHHSLSDMEYLGVHRGYNLFQQSNAKGYTALKANDRHDRLDGVGSVAELCDWINRKTGAYAA